VKEFTLIILLVCNFYRRVLNGVYVEPLVIPCLRTGRNHWLFCTAIKQRSEMDLGIYASIYFPLLDTDNFTAANYKQVTFKVIYLPTL
jgi:hypothetical protein